MIPTMLERAAVTVALMLTLPAAALAQGEADATPQGVEWHLSGYAVDGQISIVPWHVDATLVLEDGTASGSSGCNRFTGSYTLDGESLTFDPTAAMTRMACAEDQSAVEDGYMANLPLTATWAIEDGDLLLSSADGSDILGFEQSVIALTASDVTALSALFDEQRSQIDQLGQRLDSIRIGTLRERIKSLEGQVGQLQADLAAAEASSPGNGSGSSFTSAEQTLLKGVPARIRPTCASLRGSNLPRGTVAALQCDPNPGLVSEMAYYLMEYENARRTFLSVMRGHSVPERFGCPDGKPSQFLLHPNAAEGCFVDGGRANVRAISMGTSCTQLDAGGTHLTSPVIYTAIEGTGRQITPLWDWTRDRSDGFAVARQIPAPGQPTTPICEGGF